MLRQFAPFRYLPKTITDEIEAPVNLFTFDNGETIYQPGETSTDVYVIKHGSILIERQNQEENHRLNVYGTGIYFGERAILFEELRISKVRANPSVTCWKIRGDLFLSFIIAGNQQAFTKCKFGCEMSLFMRCNNIDKLYPPTLSIGEKLTIFSSIDQFQATILNGITNRHLNFEKIMELYKRMQPAIHPKLKSEELDTDAWMYAARRLPSNITSVNMILFSTKILKVLENDKELSEKSFVKTAARRRSTHTLLDGKIFVLLRDSTSDLIDFITNLCLHAVETKKLQTKLGEQVPLEIRTLINASRKGTETADMKNEFLKHLPLSDREKQGLNAIWPTNLIQNVGNMVYQYGDYKLMLSTGVDRYYEDISEKWAQKVYETTCKILGCDSINTSDLAVDIISSNTHSVVNIFSPYLHSKKDEILEWGRKHKPEIFEQSLLETDILYIIYPFYARAFPETVKERTLVEEANGFTTIFEEDLTGVTVQIIEPSKLSPSYHDPAINPKKISSTKKHLIVNIDFCFGHQAEDILGCLILIYGTSIRSVNVLGKAGGLMGSRGDVLMPTHVLLQVHDELRTIVNAGLDPLKIANLCGRQVHVGPVLTIEGTLLQDRTLLHYYKKFYHVVGLEMEGSYYVKSIERAMMSGMLSETMDTRFLYYVSDIPLDTESTLAKSLSPWEGIPPLYATTRVVLEQIFASMENGSKPNVHHTASTAMNKVKWGLRVMNAITHHPKSN